jgi:hypothetical protein
MNDSGLQTRQARNEEAKLDRKIRSLLGKGPLDYPAEEWRGIREQLRLTLLYPGRYVAFRDHYTGEGASLRLIHRKVLLDSRSLTALNKRLARLPQEVQQGVQVTFVDPDQSSEEAAQAPPPLALGGGER